MYLTYWSVFLTFIHYFLACLSYQSKSVKPICCVSFEIVWPLNVLVTILYWCYLFPYNLHEKYLGQNILANIFPVICTGVEFYLSKIKFSRRMYLYPTVLLIMYFFVVLLPYTLLMEVVYPEITFQNYITYLGILGVMILLFAILEISRFIQVKSCKSSNEIEVDQIIQKCKTMSVNN